MCRPRRTNRETGRVAGRPWRRRGAAALATVPLLFAAACWHRARPGAAPLRIERVSPALGEGAAPLLLNDTITVYFSRPIDPLSVIADTVAVVDAAGHPVPGRLDPGRSWVTFEPRPPLLPALDDGSLLPDSEYELVVVGLPRPDAIRGEDGDRLIQGLRARFRTAPLGSGGDGRPAPLRQVHSSLPFVSQTVTGELSALSITPLSVDDPRLLLHFTLPVLPTSLSADAFDITLFRDEWHLLGKVVPRGLRLLPQLPIDDYPGCTVEIDLGTAVTLQNGSGPVPLKLGDNVAVKLAGGDTGLRDYDGRTLPPVSTTAAHFWLLVQSVAIAEWPGAADDHVLFGDDLGVPGFEVLDGGGADAASPSVGRPTTLRPLVRLEAGDGSLGMFRPRQDCVLRPGEPFDRGDGVVVQSRGDSFPFLGIDVPADVRVRVDARRGPVRLLACGRARISGVLEIDGEGRPHGLRSGQPADLSTVVEAGPVTLLAAGGVEVKGAIESHATIGAPVALVTGGLLDLRGAIPTGAVLVTERPEAMPALDVVGRDPVSLLLQLTPGLPLGVQLRAHGFTPYRAMSYERTSGVLHCDRRDAGVDVAWQIASPDPLQPERPDTDPGAGTAPRAVQDGERVDGADGHFLRLRLEADVRGGEPLPLVSRLRILDA